MGSTMNAKIKALDPYTVDIAISYQNGDFHSDKIVSMQSEEEKVIDLHFASNPNNFASINVNVVKPSEGMGCTLTTRGLHITERDSGVKANFYTITCVADWMWFLLTLAHDYGEYLEIVEARPDPRELVAKAVYFGGGPLV